MVKGSCHSKEAKRKMSEAHKSKRCAKETKQKISETLKGKLPHTEECRRKISEAMKGNTNRLGTYQTPEAKHKSSEVSKRYWQNPEVHHKQSKLLQRLWQDPDYVRKIMLAHHMKPNRAERKLDAILQEVCPGEFALNVRANIMILGRKVPDFVNMNGKKQLIELYGDYWHRNDNPQDRIDYFKQFGDWETLIIWEHELKDEAVLKQKLLTFAGKGG